MNEQIIKKRIKAIRANLKEAKADWLIVTSTANVSFLTGFMAEDCWALLGPRNVYIFASCVYIEQARKDCPCCKVIEITKPMVTSVALVINKKLPEGLVLVEESTSVSAFNKLRRQLKPKIKAASNIIEPVRTIKITQEVNAIVKASQICAAAAKKIRRFMKAGITESRLAGLLDLEIRNAGSMISFDTIVAFGANASRPHHKPTEKKLKKNDTILIDFGAKYNGYCCDITRNFVVGTPSKAYIKAFKAVEKAQQAAIDAVKHGAFITDVDEAARQTMKQSGLPVYGHGTGHGLGLEVHETPFISAKTKGKLEEGMVITIEPGVYLPGKFGIRIEDDVLVTKTGSKVLTGALSHLKL